jgi:sulfofructose kinase
LNRTCDVLGIGLNATDTLLLVDEFPPYAGKVPFERELLSPGGQVATAMVACAKLDFRASYIGSIGDNRRGRIQRESLEGTGVDTSGLIVREGCPNQTAYIIIDTRTGERTVLWQRAECLRLTASDIRPEDVASARMLHIDGCDVEAAAYAASIAREYGIPVSLDVDTVYPDFDCVLKHVDYLVAGSDWLHKWTGEADFFIALKELQAAYGMRVAASTLGEGGALALENGCWAYSPGFHVPAVDTTGAGDVFHGAFCCAVLEGMPLERTLEFSNAAAAINCTAIGARGHIPSRAEIESLILAAAACSAKRCEAAEIIGRLPEKALRAPHSSS